MNEKVLTEVMHEMGDSILDHAEDICAAASTDQMFFVPVIVVAAIQTDTSQMVASNCMFGANQPLDGVSTLLKRTAANLVGEGSPDDGEVTITIDGGFQ